MIAAQSISKSIAISKLEPALLQDAIRPYFIELNHAAALRENMKTRPAFCRPLTEEAYKTFKHDFYRNEEKTRQDLPNLHDYDARALSGMTHIELFSYPVWEDGGEDGIEDGAYYVLFDYSQRDPLTRDARIVRLNVR